MKSLAIATLLLFGLLAARPVLAQTHASTPSAPHDSCLTVRPTVRPLTRYLAATLRLTPEQAAAVQRALHAHAIKRLTPEQLALNLGPVLSVEAQQRLLDMQRNAASYQTLAYLTTRR